jgi:predicted ATPase
MGIEHMDMLKRIELKGFRSIKEMDLELRPLNVLIGANGSGKSNLISFFRMLNEMMGGRLQQYIATNGRAQSLLHFGPKVTPQLEARLEFEEGDWQFAYVQKLIYAPGDGLAFARETFLYQNHNIENNQLFEYESLLAGAESWFRLSNLSIQPSDPGNMMPTAKGLIDLLNQCRVYHFHDTSPTARVRQYGYIADNKSLLFDAANLAAFLYRLKNEREIIYHRIIETIRLIAPFFVDFDLEPTGVNKTDIMLNWRHEGSDLLFGPHQISDGTLRAMCLVALLLQPEDELPGLIIVDEPELGLHPYALEIIASQFQAAAMHSQVLISTQSSAFLNHFEPGDIIVVEREGGQSTFRRPDAAALEAWLDEYSLGEVWEKNVIGGGPH